MTRFEQAFRGRKPIIAMLHLKADLRMDMMTRAKEEIRLYYENGVDAVLVENYFGAANDCEKALAYLQSEYPDRIYGVNILGDWEMAFDLADRYGAAFIQIDSVCGHLPPEADGPYAEQVKAARSRSQAAVLGGVRFKYQAVRSGRTVEEDLRLGMERCDAIVVTGEGTGLPTPDSKLSSFRDAVEDFPLIVGAGVTDQTVAAALRNADGAIIGSWFKQGHDAYGDVVDAYVQEIVTKGRGEL